MAYFSLVNELPYFWESAKTLIFNKHEWCRPKESFCTLLRQLEAEDVWRALVQ
jgi:hypothetical protein